MSKTFVYLMYFTIYSFSLLIIGKASLKESNSLNKFFVGERKVGVWRLFFTFVGTWISAATILGFTGNVYERGVITIMNSVVPWFLGTIMLYLISDRLYDNQIVTIPQLIRQRYNSRELQILSALLIAGCYIFYLVIQIKGFGIAASNLLNIDYKVAVFLVYLFILYSTFGGFSSVARTDAFNLIMLTISVGVIYFVILDKTGGSFTVFTDAMAFGSARAEGSSPIGLDGRSVFTYCTVFFGWGLGLAANPQYMIRLVSARDKKTAKRMIIYALIFLTVFYLVLLQIGLGLKVLYPEIQNFGTTDDIFVYAINRLLYNKFSGFCLISIIGACISTANSQLLLIGSSLSYDVVKELSQKELSEDRLLSLTRIFIFLGGTASLFFSFNPPPDTLSYGGDIWGFFAVIFFPLIYGALFWGKGTRKGACSCFVVGLCCSLVLYGIPMEVHWAFPSTLCSLTTFVVVSLWDRRKTDKGESHG